MDHRSTYSARVGEPPADQTDGTRLHIQKQLERFVLDFRHDNDYVYRNQLQENALLKKYYCDVNINDLINYNEELAHRLVNEPAEIIPLFEEALRQCTHQILFPHDPNARLPEHQLLLHSSAEEVSIRDLDSMKISRLAPVPGIVIGASVMSSKASELVIQCRNCQNTQHVPVFGGFSGVTLPRQCERKRLPNDPTEKCPLDPYFVIHEKSRFVDQQVIKLQEAPDKVPVGELPRHVLISADRYLTNRVVPGSRCTITGIFSIYQNKGSKNSSTGGAVAIRTPYLRAVGIKTDIDQSGRGQVIFSDEEEQEFLEMSRRPDLYNVMAECIAPSIYGNADIKKAILCLLLGGSKKILPDGMKLRGDINVLLLGDPGSSAAGLTASVQREHTTREFYLEGGAMVLADGGVVCIDEFDKMRDEDRVAIHEAMEQQTISIAKAGITTILNARTSVLAAANPIFGRYDDMKTPGENIDFQTTILSRFDMIFIVKDDHTREKDERIAKHVMGIHMGGRGAEEQVEAEIPVEKMKRYLSYCRSRMAPRLSPEAAEKLSSHFVNIRRQVHASEMEANTRSSIPITVRQLEAIIRITESLAKLTLTPIATEQHVDEAIRLFLGSTMEAVNQGSNQGSRELNEEVGRLETELKRRLAVGWSTSLASLKREMCEQKGFSEQALNRTLMMMQRRDTIMFRNQGAQVYRNAI
ncbi:DNA replication licensing factor mcm5 like protein [Verticillium longisporum]|uniref:DNA helicase n=1 Tax=Verticillium longisporum TaxID=100787 RepID=A0A8I3AM90_VERLO|nr:DNA replication licensing factor mcm5 like protein [Verticillium longisporum]